jgi:hypothetical protein
MRGEGQGRGAGLPALWPRVRSKRNATRGDDTGLTIAMLVLLQEGEPNRTLADVRAYVYDHEAARAGDQVYEPIPSHDGVI